MPGSQEEGLSASSIFSGNQWIAVMATGLFGTLYHHSENAPAASTSTTEAKTPASRVLAEVPISPGNLPQPWKVASKISLSEL
jgi:hypothetical protein